MISTLRRSLDTWIVRALFMVMVAAFVLWGVGDILRYVFSPATWVAKVDGQTIQGPQFQAEFQRSMNQATSKLPSGQEPTPKLRNQVGEVVLQRMIAEAALRRQLNRLRIVTPDAAVRAQVYAMPAFHGSNGKFSRQVLDSVLANNGLTQEHFLAMVRQQISQRQLLEAVAAGAQPPAVETKALFQAEFEKRSATMAKIPIAAQPAPPAPTAAQLKRWYENHPDSYRAPEYRRVRAIVLSPQTLSGEINITDQELHAAYDQNRAQYITPAQRSARVVTVPDQAKAKALAADWSGSTGWSKMQAAAKQAGGSAIELDSASRQMFPDPALATAVFSAAPHTVVGPVKGALAWYVLKVTKATPGSKKSFDQVKQKLRDRILADKATDLMYDRANKVDNLLGNGTPLDKLPSGLGLAGVVGTMDAQGDDRQGTPAPIPGPPALKSALIKAAFKAHPGDLPELTEVRTPSTGGSAYYALSVAKVIPAKEKPFDSVKQQVQADWTDHQRAHAAETKAAHMLQALKGGQSMADAATVAGAKVEQTPLVTRDETAEGMPPKLQHVLFGLKKGEPAMVETSDNFIVAEPAEIVQPDPKSDPSDYQRLQKALQRSMAGDLAGSFTQALRQRANPRVNKGNYDSIVRPQ